MPSLASAARRDAQSDAEDFATLLDARARLIAAADQIADILDRWPETTAEQWMDATTHYSSLAARPFATRWRPRPSAPRADTAGPRKLRVIEGGRE